MFTRSAEGDKPFPIDAYHKADDYLTHRAAADIGLPAQIIVHYAASDKLRLLPPTGAPKGQDEPLDWVSVGFARDIGDKVEMTEGALPKPSTAIALPVSSSLPPR